MTRLTILLWIAPLYFLWKLSDYSTKKELIKGRTEKIIYWFFAPILAMIIAPIFNAVLIFLLPELTFQNYYIKGYWSEGKLYQYSIYEAYGVSLFVAYGLNLGTWPILYFGQLFMMPSYGNKDEPLPESKKYDDFLESLKKEKEEQEPEEATGIEEVETVKEAVLEEFKVSDSENCRIFESKLIIDGASYSDMGDYSWFFTLANENFPALYTALTGQADLPDDVTAGLKQYLLENGATVTQLKEVCEANNIEYGFTNYM